MVSSSSLVTQFSSSPLQFVQEWYFSVIQAARPTGLSFSA